MKFEPDANESYIYNSNYTWRLSRDMTQRWSHQADHMDLSGTHFDKEVITPLCALHGHNRVAHFLIHRYDLEA
jgi:hypothetical protein